MAGLSIIVKIAATAVLAIIASTALSFTTGDGVGRAAVERGDPPAATCCLFVIF
jgi:hypothetical protein